jgi:acyl-CoA thioester hydrolase
VAETHCKYASPAKYDEVLVIETALDPTIKAGIKFDYKIFHEDGLTLVAQGYTLHPYVNTDGKVVRPPKFMKEILEKTKD